MCDPASGGMDVRAGDRRGWPRRLAWLSAWLLTGLLAVSAALVLALRWVDPPTSAFVLRHNWIAEREPGWRPATIRWTDWSAIAAPLPLAVVAAEDQRFPQHWGFDLEAISRALDAHQRGERLRGASTISQQVAKNLFLWPGKNYFRKGIEAYLTVWLELLWSKRRILEVYLNIAQFGDRVFGAEAAARHHFGVTADRLTSAQAAALAAVLPAPTRYSPAPADAHVRQQRAWILEQMARLGRSHLEGIVPANK